MAVFPLQIFVQGQDDALVGYDEVYGSSALNIRFAGQPIGVYRGFIPSVVGSILTLGVDPTLGYSIAKLPSGSDPAGLDVIISSDITLDFTGQPDVDFPMFVLLKADYSADGSSPTTAEVFTRSDTVAVDHNELRLCVVDGPAAAISVASDPLLRERDLPLAYPHMNFGFMPGGSMESLQAAVDIVNEVIAARTALSGTTHPSISDRIADDYSATEMSKRIALAYRALRSNDYSISAGHQELNVSGSFTGVDRDHKPQVTLDGDGDEQTEGAIAAPNDSVRNVALVVDANSGYRLIDNATDRNLIFGRIEGPDVSNLSGEWKFTNAIKTVVTTDNAGQATTELEVGDLIQGPDGNYYQVAVITSNNSITLRTAYQGITDTITSAARRRWKLKLKKHVGGNEIDASLEGDSTIRFFFSAFLQTATSSADWTAALHTGAERPPLLSASTAIPGTVRLAVSGAKLGSINVQNAGVPLPGGPFHTINFVAPNAAINSPNDGEIEVTEIGPQGPKGPDGTSGAPGPQGDQGPGFSAINPFEKSPEYAGTPGTTVPFSFTTDMGHNVRYIAGNIAKFRDSGHFQSPGDRVDITNISASGTQGTIEGTFGGIYGDNYLTVFLSSAGD